MADVHDTLLRLPSAAGLFWIAQLVPFHRSLTVPTAMQAVLDVHDTPLEALKIAPGGFGVLASAQLAPFHHSANSQSGGPPRLVSNSPTAVQAADDAHDTPWNIASPCPADGFGVLCIAQTLPFHRSTSGTEQQREKE